MSEPGTLRFYEVIGENLFFICCAASGAEAEAMVVKEIEESYDVKPPRLKAEEMKSIRPGEKGFLYTEFE